jgi:N-acyl-L-homoserine lactone synthetase
MKKQILAALLLAAAGNASASYNVEPLRAQRARMDSEISARNQLLDRIGFTARSRDASTLAFINSIELNVEFTLQSLETFLETLNNIQTYKSPAAVALNIEAMRNSLSNICASLTVDIQVERDEVADKRIRDSVNAQIENVRTGCDMVRGTVLKDGKRQFLY